MGRDRVDGWPRALPAQDSFERAKAWVAELQREGSLNMVIALAGNKLDLVQSVRRVLPCLSSPP